MASIDRRNTGFKFLCWDLVLQGLSGALVELLASLLDQGSDDALGVLVFDLRGYIAVVRSHDEVALPVPWHGPTLDLRRAFTDPHL